MARREFFVRPNMEGKPFSSAVRAGDFILVSGHGGHTDDQGKPVVGIEAQTRQSLEKLGKALELAGASLSDVVQMHVFLKNAEDWDRMNEVYKDYFPKGLPARSAVVPGLISPDMLVEMECIAYKP